MKRMTAEELIRQRAADPEFVRKEAERHAALEARLRQLAAAEGPLVKALQAAGVHVVSVWDLVNAPNSYDGAIPILIAHLQREYPGKIKEGIARALAVPAVRPHWARLMQLFRESIDPAEREGLAVALSASADEEHISQVIEVLNDPSLGAVRLHFVPALTRVLGARAEPELRRVVDDSDLAREARFRLRRIERGHRRGS